MTRETKAGLVVSCSFLCLVGVVLFSKVNEKEANGTGGPDERELAQLMEEPHPASPNTPEALPETPAASPPAGVEDHPKATRPGSVIPAEYREREEREGTHSIFPPNTPPKEPPANEANTPAAPEKAVGPAPKPALPGPLPQTNPPPPTAKPETTLASGASFAPKLDSGPDSQETKHNPAELRASEPPLVQPPKVTAKEDEKPASANPKKTESATPSTPLSLLKKVIKTGGTANAIASNTPAKNSEPWDPGSSDAKPAAPGTVPGDAASSPAPPGAAATKPAPSGLFPLPTTNSAGPTHPEPPKAPGTGEIPPWPARDTASAEGAPKPETALTAPASPGGHKPVLPLPEPPPSAPGLRLNAQASTPRPDKILPAGGKSDNSLPVTVQPPAGADQKPIGSGGEHKAPGTIDGITRPSSAVTAFPSPPAHPASPPLDSAPRPNVGFNPPPTPRSTGVGQDLGTHPASDGNATPGQDKSSPKGITPTVPAMPSSPAVARMEKNVPSGSLAAAPSQPNPSSPAPAPFTPALPSTGNAASQPRPPLGAPAPAASPPISVPEAPPAPVSLNPQVESYDEDTYTCKPNDTFRTISQAVYHSDQYEHALQLFNRNHPLAGAALRQDPPLLKPGQPVYIPPVRILEKYYGAPKLDSPPHSPSPPPPARAPERSDTGGSAQPTNLSLVGFGTPVKSLPPTQSTPLYRVHDGGEMMYEIARRTLGNGARWTEISRLNPRFDPKEVIPAGSTLQLPKDAHVSPPDVP